MLILTVHTSQYTITYCADDIFTFLVILTITATGRTFENLVCNYATTFNVRSLLNLYLFLRNSSLK